MYTMSCDDQTAVLQATAAVPVGRGYTALCRDLNFVKGGKQFQ